MGGIIILLILLFLGLMLYFLPAFIALITFHRNAAAIAVLNLLAGWTVVGWLIAIVWAFTNSGAPKSAVSTSEENLATRELRAEIIKAESRIDGMVADRVVVAHGLEEWLRARGWQRDFEKFGNLDWYSPRHGIASAPK